MASAYKMMVAGISAAWFLFCLGIYVIVIGPLMTTIIPLMHQWTPPYWWAYLGGNNLLWMTSFVWMIILISGILIIVRMAHEATAVSAYESGF